MSIRASLVFIAISCCAVSRSGVAFSADKNECVAAYEQAQMLRAGGKLRAARDQLLSCIQPTCPAFIKTDCTQWLADVDASTPTVVISARDKSGHEVTSVRVTADGTPFLESLDGKAMPLDPGPHVLRFERGSDKPIEQRYVIHQGERNRPITVQLGGPEVIAAEGRSGEVSGPSGWGWFLGAVGVAGVGSFAYFGLSGQADLDRLRSRCAPSCAQQDIDLAQRKLIIADVSLGVGLASLGAATWFFLSKGSKSMTPGTVSQVEVRPLLRGGVAEVTVSF